MGIRYLLSALGLLIALQGAHAQATAPESPTYRDAELTMRVEAEGAQLRLYIAEAAGAQRSVGLSEQLLRVNALHRAGPQALVLGALNGADASELTLVDWTSGAVVDRFRGWYFALSADARAFAYLASHEGRFYAVRVALASDGGAPRVRVELLDATEKPPALDPKYRP